MTFDDWWADYGPDYDEITARDAWRAACTAAAGMVAETAFARKMSLLFCRWILQMISSGGRMRRTNKVKPLNLFFSTGLERLYGQYQLAAQG